MHIAPDGAFYKPIRALFDLRMIHSENWFPRAEIML